MEQSVSTCTEMQHSYRKEERLVTGDDWHFEKYFCLAYICHVKLSHQPSADAAATDVRCLYCCCYYCR